MFFDIKKVPFSICGSRLVISYVRPTQKYEEGLYIRNVQGGDNFISRLFKIDLFKGNEKLNFETEAEPGLLTLKTNEGYAKFCICEEKLLRFYGKGVSLRLSLRTGGYDNAIPQKDGRWEINNYTEEIKLGLSALKGVLDVDAPWEDERSNYITAEFKAASDEEIFEGAVEEYYTILEKREYKESFEECSKKVKKDFEKWLENTLKVKEEFEEGRKLAAYITWSCVVSPKGKLTRPAMYMSKNWMTNIWSWDHCFNAMALVDNNPSLAFDQLMVFIDNQDYSGVFPDYINDRYVSFSCCKPPIHGWTVKYLMNKNPSFFTKDRLEELYEPLCRWTNYWFKYRDEDEDGIPQYSHGNDSGWDNSTVFGVRPPIESPDLTSFLIIQMDTLRDIAEKIGKTEEAKFWEERSKATLKRLLEHNYVDGHFVAVLPRENHKIHHTESLILYIPLILGKKLPKQIIDSLLKGLKEEGKFITDNGFATESVKSPYYREDGYWRGPIWAPTTMLMVYALLQVGEKELALDIARKYCNMAQKTGMAENFNAITGEGLRDKAFTWTSSVYLMLGNMLLEGD